MTFGRLFDSTLLLVIVLVVLGLAGGFGLQTWTELEEADAHAPPGELVDVGGRLIHLDCRGESVIGRPTVLLEAPLMTASDYWRPVQDLLVPFTRTCSYDRAGLGFSDADPEGRGHVGSYADDLQRALAQAGIGGPMLIVGAEEGAVYAQSFAALNSDIVVAMVLVDPTTLALLDADDGRRLEHLQRDVAAHRWAVEVWAGRKSIGDWIRDQGLAAIDSERLRWQLSHRRVWRAGVQEVTNLRRAVVEMSSYRGDAFPKPTIIVNTGRATADPEASRQFADLYAVSLRALSRRYPKSTLLESRVLAVGSPASASDGPLALVRPLAVVEAVNRVLGLVAAPAAPLSTNN